MTEKISMLMDGELDSQEAALLVSRMEDAERADWRCYHLIGDAIRDPEGFRADLGMDCCKALDAEPTVLAPRKSGFHNVKLYTLSAAASVAAVLLVGWVALQGPEDSPVPKQVAQVVHLNIIKAKLSDYLLAHQEFSPGAEMATPNIRTVSETYQENGR